MLRFSHLCVTRGKRDIFSDLNAAFEPGQLVALVGENGAGKSTLLHTLAGNLPYSGKIELSQRELKQWQWDELAHMRAVLTQHHDTAFNFGIPEMIAMGRYHLTESQTQCHKRVQELVQLLSLNHLLDRSTQQLSGGELQRVHMARCLAQLDAFHCSGAGKMLLLDEPTSALDIRHQHSLMQLVRRFVDKDNLAIIAIHDLNLAAIYADSVCLLHNGAIQAFGSPQKVFTANRLNNVYGTPMHISHHPDFNYTMIFSEPKEYNNETSSLK